MAEPLTINVTRAAASTPKRYTVPGAVDIEPLAAFASFDGSLAASEFLPCIAFYSAAGILIGRYYPSQSVAAGGSADVSFAPFLGDQGDIHYGSNRGGYLIIETTDNGPSGQGSLLFDVFQDWKVFIGRDVNITGAPGRDWNQSMGGDVNITAGNDYNPRAGNDVNLSAARDCNLEGTRSASLALSPTTARIDLSSTTDHQVVWDAGHKFLFYNGGTSFGEQPLVELRDQTSTETVVFTLRAGKRLLVQDENGQGLFRVDDNGDLHGLTGKALTFDL